MIKKKRSLVKHIARESGAGTSRLVFAIARKLVESREGGSYDSSPRELSRDGSSNRDATNTAFRPRRDLRPAVTKSRGAQSRRTPRQRRRIRVSLHTDVLAHPARLFPFEEL